MRLFFVLILLVLSYFGLQAQEIHEARFYPTKLYQKGAFEVKLFNNYYTEAFKEGSSMSNFRQDFYASFLQVLIGTDKNLNFGLDLKYRSAATSNDKSNRFLAFPFKDISELVEDPNINFRRTGLSAIGPRIKYTVKSEKGAISILHAVYFPTLTQAQGISGEFGFADWDHLQFYNNIFFEKKLDGQSNIFIDAGLHFENIGGFLWNEEGGYAQILTPVTFIYNYYPSWKTTFYGLVNFSPRFGLSDGGSNIDIQPGAFSQVGVGAKRFIRPWLEVELLYTQFFNFGSNSSASTMNLGLRYSRN